MNDSSWTESDIWYGLRNILVGDEEDTRIETEIPRLPEKIGKVVKVLVEVGEYDMAYRVAIKTEALRIFQKLNITKLEVSAERWVVRWSGEEGQELGAGEVTAKQLVILLLEILDI